MNPLRKNQTPVGHENKDHTPPTNLVKKRKSTSENVDIHSPQADLQGVQKKNLNVVNVRKSSQPGNINDVSTPNKPPDLKTLEPPQRQPPPTPEAKKQYLALRSKILEMTATPADKLEVAKSSLFGAGYKLAPNNANYGKRLVAHLITQEKNLDAVELLFNTSDPEGAKNLFGPEIFEQAFDLIQKKSESKSDPKAFELLITAYRYGFGTDTSRLTALSLESFQRDSVSKDISALLDRSDVPTLELIFNTNDAAGAALRSKLNDSVLVKAFRTLTDLLRKNPTSEELHKLYITALNHGIGTEQDPDLAASMQRARQRA